VGSRVVWWSSDGVLPRRSCCPTPGGVPVGQVQLEVSKRRHPGRDHTITIAVPVGPSPELAAETLFERLTDFQLGAGEPNNLRPGMLGFGSWLPLPAAAMHRGPRRSRNQRCLWGNRVGN